MKTVKSVWLAFYYIIVIAIFFAVIYNNEIFRFLGRVQKSDEGVLLSIFNKLAYYFQYADKWNLVFIIFFISVLLILFVLNDLAMRELFDWMASGNKKLKFLKSSFSQLFLQKGMSTIALFIEVVIILNLIVIIHANKNTLDSPRRLTSKKVVLLLGTNKHIHGTDKPNLYYSYRIKACRDLYQAGVVDYFIISGDKTGEKYNEPEDMKRDLMAFGVKASQIKLDTAGFRTLDSILRLRSIFDIQEVIIVSQSFHIQRALFLSWFYRLKAWGYNAEGSMTPAMIKREVMAKPKVILDLFFFNMQPRSEQAKYRAEFEVNSDLHVLLIILLAVLLVMSFILVVKSFDVKEAQV
jgi:vancomycin permeability regulator SanA